MLAKVRAVGLQSGLYLLVITGGGCVVVHCVDVVVLMPTASCPWLFREAAESELLIGETVSLSTAPSAVPERSGSSDGWDQDAELVYLALLCRV